RRSAELPPAPQVSTRGYAKQRIRTILTDGPTHCPPRSFAVSSGSSQPQSHTRQAPNPGRQEDRCRIWLRHKPIQGGSWNLEFPWSLVLWSSAFHLKQQGTPVSPMF